MKQNMKIGVSVVLATALSLSISGCGGSNDSSTPPPSNSQESVVAGKAIDGYLQKAKVCIDINNNSKCDVDEPSATTDSSGSYSITTDVSNLSAYNVLVEAVAGVTVDSDTPNAPVAQAFFLKAPADEPEVVSPMTTLVQNNLELNASLTKEAVVAQLKEDLNVSDSVDILGDYVAAKATSTADVAALYEKVHTVARVVTKAMAKTMNENANVTDDNYNAVAKVILEDISNKVAVIEQETQSPTFNEDSYVLNVEINSSKLADVEQKLIIDTATTTDVIKQLISSKGGAFGMDTEFIYDENNLLKYSVSIPPAETVTFEDGTVMKTAYASKYEYNDANQLLGTLEAMDFNYTSYTNMDFGVTAPTPNNPITYYTDGSIASQSLYMERFGEHTVPLMGKQKAYTTEELTLLYVGEYPSSSTIEYNTDGRMFKFTMGDFSGQTYTFSSPVYENGKLVQAISDDDIHRLNYEYNEDGLVHSISIHHKLSDGSVIGYGMYFFEYAMINGENRLIKASYFDSNHSDGHLDIDEYRYLLDSAGYVTKYTYAFDVASKIHDEGSYVTTYTWEAK